MRTEGKIRHKLKQVRYRHQKKKIRTSMSRRPCNCVFNTDEVEVSTHVIRACGQETRLGIICDSQYGGDAIAARCPFFEPALGRDQIKEEFDDFIQTASLPELATEMPDLMALIWVLGDPDGLDAMDDMDIPEEPVVEIEEEENAALASEDFVLTKAEYIEAAHPMSDFRASWWRQCLYFLMFRRWPR